MLAAHIFSLGYGTNPISYLSIVLNYSCNARQIFFLVSCRAGRQPHVDRSSPEHCEMIIARAASTLRRKGGRRPSMRPLSKADMHCTGPIVELRQYQLHPPPHHELRFARGTHSHRIHRGRRILFPSPSSGFQRRGRSRSIPPFDCIIIRAGTPSGWTGAPPRWRVVIRRCRDIRERVAIRA